MTGMTLSAEQHREGTRRATAAGMADRVRFVLRDYWQETRTYDHTVSVSMFGHVGRTDYDACFARVRGLLREDGMALPRSIGENGTPLTRDDTASRMHPAPARTAAQQAMAHGVGRA